MTSSQEFEAPGLGPGSGAAVLLIVSDGVVVVVGTWDPPISVGDANCFSASLWEHSQLVQDPTKFIFLRTAAAAATIAIGYGDAVDQERTVFSHYVAVRSWKI